MTFSNFWKKVESRQEILQNFDSRDKDTLDHSAAEGLFLANHTQLKPIHYSGLLRVVTPPDARPVNWPANQDSIHQNHTDTCETIC